MDSLSAVLSKAIAEGVISSFTGISAAQRLSVYADDVALFIKPSVQDLEFVRDTFAIFGEATGLRINYSKSSAVLIRGNDQGQQRVAALLHCNIGSFPCRYLGLPLAIKQLTRVD